MGVIVGFKFIEWIWGLGCKNKCLINIIIVSIIINYYVDNINCSDVVIKYFFFFKVIVILGFRI